MALETIDTPKGPVEIRPYVDREELAGLELDPGIGRFSRYRSILSGRQGLSEMAELSGANLCLAVHEGRSIVGYCVRRPPEADERWAQMDPPILHELFGENARGWRNYGLMRPMLKTVVLEPENDARILYIVGYSWHWDLDETKKTLDQYRDTIISLLAPLGFKQYPTNEPNVSLRSENLFMARIGEQVEISVKKRFTNLLFGIVGD